MHKLTIIIPTYNKEKYIAETLQSILKQKTSFSYKILIADDCSSDNSLQIAHSFQQQYPNTIEILTSQQNNKLYKNVLRAYEAVKSDYFCVLDPDDYWKDEFKIEKALSFLEANQDYAIYTTNTLQLEKNGKITPWSSQKENSSDFNDFLQNKAKLGHTSSSIFRNIIFKNGVPKKMLNIENNTCETSFRGDSFRNAMHIKEGKAFFSEEYSSVYRITDEGLWQGSSSAQQNLMNAIFWINLWKYYDRQYPQFLLNAQKNANKLSKEDILELFNKHYDLQYLFATLKENSNTVSQELYNNLTPKYRLFFKIHNWLNKKLQRKNYI